MDDSQPRVLDLFCGAGGLSLGFTEVGFDVAAGVDRAPDYLATYEANHDATALQRNLHTVPPEDFFADAETPDSSEVDVIAGGPPCKGFSIAGERAEGDQRDNLVSVFLDYVEYADPEFVVMENVEGIRTKELPDDGLAYIEMVERRLTGMGYVFHEQLLDAADYAVPQNRERVFVVGHRPEHTFAYPDPVEGAATAGKALREVPEDAPNHRDTMTDHGEATEAELRELDYGESRYENYGDSWRRIHPDEPAPTVKENHGAPFVHPFEPRVGTVRECAKLQSFPDDFVFKGSKSKQLKQVGNAVPPRLAEAVADCVWAHLHNPELEGEPGTTSHQSQILEFGD